MKRSLLALTALVASSFTPIEVPPLVSRAAAELPDPSILLCNDTGKLGSSRNLQRWGNPYLLPFNYSDAYDFQGPFGSGDTEHYTVTVTRDSAAIIQRCPVLTWNGHETGKHQDVQLAPPSTFVVDIFDCQAPLTPAGQALGYVECPGAGNTVRGNPNR